MQLGNDAALKILARLPLFEGLGREDIAQVRELCHGLTHPLGTRLFEQGDASDALYILLTGSVEITVQGLGRVHEIGPGEVFGEIGFLIRNQRSATAETLEESIVLMLEYARLDGLCESRPRFAERLLRNIGSAVAEHVLRMNRFHSLEHLPKRD